MDTKMSRFQNIEKINIEVERPKMIAEKNKQNNEKREQAFSGTKSNFRN